MRRLRRFVRQLVSLGGTPTGIAGGFALGLALSLIPIPFLGMVLALAAAPLLRCNLPATYLGTAVVNPLTGALFYFAELWIGMLVLGRPRPRWAELAQLDPRGWWNLFVDLVVPFGVGAGVLIIASTLLTFPLIAWAVGKFQSHRSRSRENSHTPTNQ